MYIHVDEMNRIDTICTDGEPQIDLPSEVNDHNFNEWKYIDGQFIHDPLPEHKAIDPMAVLVEQLHQTQQILNAIVESQGLTLRQLDGGAYEVVKPQVANGDYLDPILFTPGMVVEEGLWYYDTDKDLPFECIRNGKPMELYDNEFFDVIIV